MAAKPQSISRKRKIGSCDSICASTYATISQSSLKSESSQDGDSAFLAERGIFTRMDSTALANPSASGPHRHTPNSHAA